MTRIFKPLIPATLLFLAACGGNQANHLGNPLLLPILGIGNAVANNSYDARRARVSRFVNTNYTGISQQIQNRQTVLIGQAMDIAGVSGSKRQSLLDELRNNPQLYLTGDAENMVVALMVYGP